MKKKLILFLSMLCLTLSVFAACGTTKYGITLEYDSTQGSVTVTAPAQGATYGEGENVTLSVVPADGYETASVTLNGNAVELTDGKYSFSVTEDARIAVVFDKTEPAPPAKTYTVTVSCPTRYGSATLSPEKESYREGEEVTLTVSPNLGYQVTRLVVNDEVKELSARTYTFRVTGDTVISLEFGTVPMPQNFFDSLTGNVAFAGESEENRRYIGSEDGKDYEDYPTINHYALRTAYGTDAVHFYVRDESSKLVLADDVIVLRDTPLRAVRNLRGELDFEEVTGTVDDYRNPFGVLVTADDFSSAGGNLYVIHDPEKASLAARAFTGKNEKIASFKAYVMDNLVSSVQIETQEQIGQGITLDYHYTASYSFDVAEGDDLSSRTAPYPLTEEHVALERALASAADAESYTIDVTEDVSYTVFVTENAVYNDEAGHELGYIVKDGVVYEFYLEDGKTVLDDPLQFEDYDEEGNPDYHTISDITPLRADFAAFSPSLFRAAGNGVYEMYETDAALIPLVADFLYDGNDFFTMTFAKSVTITVEQETIKTVSILTDIFGMETEFVFSYRDWNETELPVQFEGEEPAPESGIPAAFYGTFRGQYHDFSSDTVTEYVVVISETGIAVTVDGTPVPAAFVAYDPDYEEISLTLGGRNFTISNYSAGDTIDEINLSSEFGSGPFVTVTLTRDGTGGEQPTPPAKKGMESFYGTYEGEDENGKYVVVISESGISVTIDGEEKTVSEVSFNESAQEITFKIDGMEYSISANSDDDPLSEIVLWYDGWHMVTLSRKA